MEKGHENEKKGNMKGLPVDTSPYTQYKDLEDYKDQGYGTQGHIQPQRGHGAVSSTDAPTLTLENYQAEVPGAIHAINRHGAQ